MEYRKNEILVCIDNTKDACLYFDHVIPLNLAHVIPWENNGDMEAFDVLKKILPASLLDSSNVTGLSSIFLSYIEVYVNIIPETIGHSYDDTTKERARMFMPLLMKRKDEVINSLPFQINSIFGAEKIEDLNEDYKVEDPAILLTGLKLIDTSDIQWRQIIELRNDKESLKKLRRFRTFIFKDYKDMPVSFIKDDILNRIELYETTVKSLGLKTRDSVMKIIFSSGSLVANTTATIVAAFSGIPLTIPLSLSIGSTFLFGNVGLELISYKRDILKFQQENPITYLMDIKDLKNNDLR